MPSNVDGSVDAGTRGIVREIDLTRPGEDIYRIAFLRNERLTGFPGVFAARAACVFGIQSVRRLVRSLGIWAVVTGSFAVGLSGAGGQTRSRAMRSGAMASAVVPAASVPRDGILVADLTGRVSVLSHSGRVLGRTPGSLGAAVQALALSPDRRRAYASIYTRNGGLRLYDLDLATGRKRALARAFGPALNPARTQLAYVTISFTSGIPFAHALVVRNLATHLHRSISFPPGVVVGTPPELIVNWSLDGKRIAVFDGHHIRLVDVATAPNVLSL